MKNLNYIIPIIILSVSTNLFSMDQSGFFERQFKHLNKEDNKLTYELIKEIDKYSPLSIISKKLGYKDERLKKIQSLINEGANINIQNQNGESLLHLACEEGILESVKLLINLKININMQDTNGNTALMTGYKGNQFNTTISYVKNSISIIKLLIKKGADYKIKNKNSESLLDIISNYGRGKIAFGKNHIKYIIEIQQNIINDIYQAINNNNKDEVKKSLLKGYKYFCDLDQNNMLHIAASKNKFEIFKLILNAAPELITEKNKDGMTPLELNPEILIKFMPQIKLKLVEVDSKEEIVDEYEDNLILPEACNII